MDPLVFQVTGDPPQMHTAVLYPADPATRRNTLLILAHGAGAGQSSPWVIRYAQGLSERGIDVVTFNFPYIDAGRRTPDRTPVLERAFDRVIVAASAHPRVHARRLFVGGKSMGGRIATHMAEGTRWPEAAPPLDGVIAFGYPLSPPGGPSKRSPDRVSHLFEMVAPALIVQGTRDTFGGPDAIRSALAPGRMKSTITVHAVQNGDHSLSVPKARDRAQAAVDAEVWDTVTAWMEEVGKDETADTP